MKMTISANIKRLRMAKNITQEQLSTAMNVTCAAVSKWERGETYPDITLLQLLAYFFGVTLDELMGYDQEKIQAEIDAVIALYIKNRHRANGREIITKAYHDYPNDCRIMHYYMWNIGGDWADNDPEVLIAHKDEFLSICEKILNGCTEEALEIYKTKFTNRYITSGQKTEQLFAKDTDEYYFHMRKNMYELVDFAADKLGRAVFFAPSLSMEEKTERALHYGDLMLRAFEETGEAFFLMIARTFLNRMENDLNYRGGTAAQIIAVMDKNLYTTKRLEELRADNKALHHAINNSYSEEVRKNLFQFCLNYHMNAVSGKREELLDNPDYQAVLNKYR